MAKPILVVRANNSFSESFDKISKSIRKHMADEYHVLVIGSTTEEPTFEVFNVDKEPEITYTKLKELINEATTDGTGG